MSKFNLEIAVKNNERDLAALDRALKLLDPDAGIHIRTVRKLAARERTGLASLLKRQKAELEKE